MKSNLPQPEITDSGTEVKTFFNQYFTEQLSFPASQIDAVVGFFTNRGFNDLSAKTTSIVLLTQAKLDGINVFKLIDSLTPLTEIQLNRVVTEILNASREKTSMLGFKLVEPSGAFEERNIRP